MRVIRCCLTPISYPVILGVNTMARRTGVLGESMNRWPTALAILVASLIPAGAWAQEPPAIRQCPELLACRSAEVNLQNYWGIPLTLQGVSSCAQFCSADYWLRHARTGELLLQFGHGGAMGPPLLAWGVVSEGVPQPALRVRTVAWIAAPNPQFIDDGWYEDTEYTWDASRELLIPGSTRRLPPEALQQRPPVRMLEDEGLQVMFGRWA
jgi:hypothetical protein